MTRKINFVGDLIFGDQPVIFGFGLNSIWTKQGYEGIFDGVSDFLSNSEYNVANFETVIKVADDKKTVSEWSMCCEETICSVLKRNNINIVSVANNHTMDYGKKWFDYTVDALTKANIRIIGLKTRPYEKIVLGDKKIAIIGCSYLKVYNHINPEYLYSPSKEMWDNIVKECDDCDVKIAYVHWGSEFIETPTNKQYECAYEILSSGVDIIIGHHPHILQTNEIIDGKKVIFSLGNFVSDYWQKRLRKTEIVSYSENDEFEKSDILINTKGAPEAIYTGHKKIEFDSRKKRQSTTLSRMRVRFEYLIKMIFNFYKIQGKEAFIRWVLKRLKYILLYSWREFKNPEIVYEYYEN